MTNHAPKLWTDRFLDTLTWAKAVRTVADKRRAKGRPEGTLPRQVSYLERLDRGLSLMLVVSAGGTKRFWAVTYRDGKPTYWKLGTYPTMGVSQARNEARQYFKHREQIEADAAVGTFQEIAEQWFKRHVEKKGLLSAQEIRRHLQKYVYPHWGKMKFLAIERDTVANLLDRIEDTNGAAQADAVLATLRGIMGWYETRHPKYVSPIVRKMRRHAAKPRKRTLDHHEIQKLWDATASPGTFHALVRMLLLTAQRREKVTSMRWDDLGDDGIWTIRQNDEREKGTGQMLKLPDLALDLIRAQPQLLGNPYVFPGSLRGQRRSQAKNPGAPTFNSFSHGKRELDAKLAFSKPWTLHDLRRTARSLMSEAGVLSDHAERVLGHAIKGVEGVYDRFAYFDAKAEALHRLAALIERIVGPAPDNVVRLRR